MKYGNYNAAAEEMVDISSGYGAGAAPMRYTPAQNGGNKNKILIISIVAAIAVALTVAGFCIFSALHQEGDDGKPVAGGNKTFVFADKTTVSGIDISGKTVKEAKALLDLDMRAADVYNLMTGRDMASESDHRRGPVIIR